jgi:hypothetical protein
VRRRRRHRARRATARSTQHQGSLPWALRPSDVRARKRAERRRTAHGRAPKCVCAPGRDGGTRGARRRRGARQS